MMDIVAKELRDARIRAQLRQRDVANEIEEAKRAAGCVAATDF